MLKRRQRRRYYPMKRVVVLVFGILLSLTLYFVYVGWSQGAVTVVKKQLKDTNKAVVEFPKLKDVLFYGVPGLKRAAVEQQAVNIVSESRTEQNLRKSLLFVTGIDIKDLRSLLSAEIPLMAAVKDGTPTVSAMSLPNFPKFDSLVGLPAGEPLVAIYHTHTAESFIPDTGASHAPGGRRGEIVSIGDTLTKRLLTHGINSVHSKNIHDYPSFMKAYAASEQTVKMILEQYPSVQMIFDIHRDADKKENVTTTINGVSVAQITILVAAGQQDLAQPRWQENHAFAKLIDAKLNQHYPGLSKGIQIVPWRYNQHLHPRMLLIEVGCQENSKKEAERAIEMFGDVIAEIISENRNN